jgi:hypothetical protein
MQHYLAAHQGFIDWLGTLPAAPSASEVERRLRSLAMVAAARGMTSTHWTFVVDGLIAHVNRAHPGDVLLSSRVARAFDYSQVWDELRKAMDDPALAAE